MQDHHSTIYRSADGDPLMGYKLVKDVMDNAPHMTLAEWKAMVILAEDANDASRLTWSPATSAKITQRLGLAPHAWANLRGALVRKGLLEVVEAGRKGRCAKYRFPMWPQIRPLVEDESEDIHPPVEDESEPFDPPEEGDPMAMSPQPEDERGPIHPQPEDASPKYVLQEVTPTHQNNSSEQRTHQPTPAAPRDPLAGSKEGVVVQEEGEENKQDARKRAESFLGDLPFLNPPGRDRKRRLQTLVEHALAAGWNEGDLMAVCEDSLNTADDRVNCWLYRLKPEKLGPAPKAGQDDPQLHSRVPKQRRASDGHRTWSDPDASAYRPPKGQHIGWQNPTDPTAYDGTF